MTHVFTLVYIFWYFSSVCTRNFHSTFTTFEDAEKAPLAPASPKVQSLIDEIMTLNIVETIELVDHLKDKFGYVESVAVAAAPAGGAAADAEPEEEVAEQTIFSVKLDKYGDKEKIKVIKEVRGITGLGLKQSKELVESAPCVVIKNLPKEEAEAIMEKINGVGGECSLE